MNRAMSCAVLALTLLAAPASAQAGAWHAELVTRAETVSVYLTDGDGKPLPAEGFKAVAILKSSAKAARILLSPEGNRLAGKAEAALGDRPNGAVRITGPGGVTASARFD